MAEFVSFLFVFCIVIHIHECCPTGYTQCATIEGETCVLSGNNIIAYGNDDFRWGYTQINGTFVCDDNILCETGSGDCDPVIGTIKQCCYQDPKITQIPSNINGNIWIAGEIHCNQLIQSYLAYEKEEHIWLFSPFSSWSATFGDCGSDASDTQLHLYDNNGNTLMDGIAGCEDGDDCGSCSSSRHEEFDYTVSDTSYYIRILPFDNSGTDYGNYKLYVACDGAPNYEYDHHLLTCEDNIITGETTTDNRQQWFQLTTNSKEDIKFETCGTEFHGTLYIYSDSLYQNQLIGGNNNDCGTYDERYFLLAQESGNYYVYISYPGTASNKYGPYILTITCFGNYSSNPTGIPTTSIPTTSIPTDIPTATPSSSPSNIPTSLPTTSDPSMSGNPTSISSSNPTSIPSSIPSSNPTSIPTTITAMPTFMTTTSNPTSIPSLNPTISPAIYTSTSTRQGVDTTSISNQNVIDSESNIFNGVPWIIWGIVVCVAIIVMTAVIFLILFIRIKRSQRSKEIEHKMTHTTHTNNVEIETEPDDHDQKNASGIEMIITPKQTSTGMGLLNNKIELIQTFSIDDDDDDDEDMYINNKKQTIGEEGTMK